MLKSKSCCPSRNAGGAGDAPLLGQQRAILAIVPSAAAVRNECFISFSREGVFGYVDLYRAHTKEPLKKNCVDHFMGGRCPRWSASGTLAPPLRFGDGPSGRRDD